MFSRRVSDLEAGSRHTSLLDMAEDAICLAVKTALKLVDDTTSVQPPEKVLVRAFSQALSLVDREADKMVTDQLPEISLDQVSWHDNPNDCWTVIYDRVYDITEFLWEVS